MGESMVEALNDENKMTTPLVSGTALEVSVSFGRFENDSLSWEKWSSFSPNKYLEEVEKCSTPGSVAQKKAYFEAHYRRIAARKAEQLEQEKQMESNCLMKDVQNGVEQEKQMVSNCLMKDVQYGVEQEKQMESNCLMTYVQNCEGQIGSSTGTDTELGMNDGQSFVEEVEQVTNSIGVTSSPSNESNENVTTTLESQTLSLDAAKEEVNSTLENLKLNKSEKAFLVRENTYTHASPENMNSSPSMVEEDTLLNGPQDKVQYRMKFEEMGKQGDKNEDANLNASSYKSQKMTPTKREKNLAATKKKMPSPLLKKPQQISTPKTSKPTSTSAVMSARSTAKRVNGSPLPRSKIPSAGESKKVASSSLHMSLGLGTANSEPTSLTTNRKSLIMEKMGDKDIVKRAFKTFQSNFSQVGPSGYERSSGQKELSTMDPEQKLSTSLTSRKENEGIRRAAEKTNAQRGQLGRSWNSPSAGPLKGAGMDQSNAKPSPSSFGLKSNERAEKRKEFFKKLEEKSFAKEAEHARLTSKSKMERQDEIKKLRQCQVVDRGHVISKSSSDKEGAKNKNHHRQEMHR